MGASCVGIVEEEFTKAKKSSSDFGYWRKNPHVTNNDVSEQSLRAISSSPVKKSGLFFSAREDLG